MILVQAHHECWVIDLLSLNSTHPLFLFSCRNYNRDECSTSHFEGKSSSCLAMAMIMTFAEEGHPSAPFPNLPGSAGQMLQTICFHVESVLYDGYMSIPRVLSFPTHFPCPDFRGEKKQGPLDSRCRSHRRPLEVIGGVATSLNH